MEPQSYDSPAEIFLLFLEDSSSCGTIDAWKKMKRRNIYDTYTCGDAYW